MAETYLIMRRTDIPDGVLQVLDLYPNTSSKNYIYPPGLGQTGYVHNIPNQAATTLVGGGPTFTLSATVSGVSAYLLGNIDTGAGAGGAPFSGAEADTAAGALIAIAQSGGLLDSGAVDGVLGGVVLGTTLSGGGSSGVLSELLATLAGNVWSIPAGTDLASGGVKVPGQLGGFVAGMYTQLYDVGHFLVSNLNGNISLMKSAGFEYGGVQGAAVTVYSASGLVL